MISALAKHRSLFSMCPVHIETAPLRAEQCGAKCILFLCTATDLCCLKMKEMYFEIFMSISMVCGS